MKRTPSEPAESPVTIMRCGYRSDEEWLATISQAHAYGRNVIAIDGAGRVVVGVPGVATAAN